MQLSADVLNETVQFLEQHEESLRIKKLIFCLCKKYWENDPNILNSFSLEDLVTELLQSRPTIDQVTFALYKLVKTLNRPKVYAGVAKIILEQLGQLYGSLDNDSLDNDSPVRNPQILAVETLKEEDSSSENQDINSEFMVNTVVSNLTNHQEESRIKKLIFALCKNRWENNTEVIENYGFKDLILELCQIYPTKKALQAALKRIVENLNKQSLYVAISNIIYKQLEILYNHLPEDIEIDRDESSRAFNTQIIEVKNNFNASPRYAEAPTVEQSEFSTSMIDFSSDQMVTELKQIQQVQPIETAQSIQSLSSVQAFQQTPPRKTYDLFELRLEIMQYTNPLRAKILLFSILYHPWDRSGQDWSMLRSYSLDDLLEQLILMRRSLSEVEAKLYAMAKSLTDPDSQMQTASTIIEAVKSFL